MDILYLHENTVWLNESLTLKRITFGKPVSKRSFFNLGNSTFTGDIITHQPIVTNGSVGGIHFPDDLIFKRATDAQELYGHVFLAKGLNVTGTIITEGTTINNVNYGRACDMASPARSMFGIHLLGESCAIRRNLAGL